MSFENVLIFVIIPGLIAALIMAIMLGYGRRLGGGAKSFGWLIALAIIGVPLFLMFSQNFGSMQAERSASIEAAPAEEAASETKTFEYKVEPETDTRSISKSADRRKRPVVRRTVRKRKSDGTVVTETTTVGGAPPPSAPVAEELVAAPVPTPPSEQVQVDERFDRVNILFGTDRNQTSTGDRIAFGANRAGKLTLGQSTVTIPKDHDRGIVERPWEFSVVGITIYKQKEDPAKHFTVQKIGVLSEEDFVAATNEQLRGSQTYRGQAAIFIHGYNNDFDTALYRTAQMAYDMEFDGAPFLYSWPSAAGYSTYEYDQQSARQSVEHLSKFIEIVTQKTDAEKIHVIAHSMGNDVLLEALRELRFKFGPDHDYKISQVILAAPDVDRNVFERLARQVARISEGVTLYASANDKALQFSRTLAGGVARAGDVPEGGPVVMDGVDTIDVSATQQDFWGINHNTYAEVSELLQDIKRVLLTGLRPPVNRTPDLQAVPSTSGGTYWRFPPKS